MTPAERLEHQLALEVMQRALQDTKARALRAEAWAAKLEQQMRREGWTQEDLDELQRG